MNGEANGDAGLEVATLQLEAVMDLPTINTRAGLYIFLNSLVGGRYTVRLITDTLQLVARPFTDDYTIINYLHSRYKVCISLTISCSR